MKGKGISIAAQLSIQVHYQNLPFVSSWRDNRFFFYVSARRHAQNDSDRVSVHFYVGAVSLVRNNWDTKVEDGLHLIRPEERPRSTRRKHGLITRKTKDEKIPQEHPTRYFFLLLYAKKYWGLQRCNINILTRIQMSTMVQNARTRCPPWVEIKSDNSNSAYLRTSSRHSIES